MEKKNNRPDPMKNPGFRSWYEKMSELRELDPRCPYANCLQCRRYLETWEQANQFEGHKRDHNDTEGPTPAEIETARKHLDTLATGGLARPKRPSVIRQMKKVRQSVRESDDGGIEIESEIVDYRQEHWEDVCPEVTYECHLVYASRLRCGPEPRYDPVTHDPEPIEDAPWSFSDFEPSAALHFSDCCEYKQHKELKDGAKPSPNAEPQHPTGDENTANAETKKTIDLVEEDGRYRWVVDGEPQKPLSTGKLTDISGILFRHVGGGYISHEMFREKLNWTDEDYPEKFRKARSRLRTEFGVPWEYDRKKGLRVPEKFVKS